MSSRLLDVNPLTGEWIEFAYNHADDTFTIAHKQDCTAIIEDNKRAMIEANHSRQKAQEMIHYARVPHIVQMNWYKDHGVKMWERGDKKKVMALLNSREYIYLKRTPIIHDR